MNEAKMLEKAQTRSEKSKIKKVEKNKDGDWTITKSDGWSFFIPKEYGVEPHVGDEVTFYGQGIGYEVQGLDINGKEVFFKTRAKMDAEHEAFCKKFKENSLKNWKETIEKLKNEEPYETVDISGMGGSYEAGCQAMLRAGTEYLKTHPDFHFDYSGFKDVYGVCFTDTPWGKELDKVLDEASGHGATGAMHQAVIGHLAHIHKVGREAWLKMFPKERRYTYPNIPAPDAGEAK